MYLGYKLNLPPMNKRIIRNLFNTFLNLLYPIISYVARFYGIEIGKSFKVHGQNPLTIENNDETGKWRGLPKSTYFNTRSGSISIGDNTVFGEHVMVLTGKHFNLTESEERGVQLHHVPLSGRDIRIGRNCYIGSGAIIIGPVEIGDYAVIGAGSVVVKNVPEKTFVNRPV